VASHAANGTLRNIPLPGATGPVSLDYIAYDAGHHRVWVPAGGTASVDVIDATTGGVTRVEGFATQEVERNGSKRTVGPSSVAFGGGSAYIGNRADSSVCAVDTATLKIGTCSKLDSPPDGLAWIPSAKELWVTTPRDKSIRVLDGTTLREVTKIPFEGEPEGFAVDDKRGLFYTNLEDKDRTLVIDVKTRKTVSTWMPRCGEDGPKGLAIDPSSGILIVACPDHVISFDANGKKAGSIEVGDGIDNIDYVEARHELFAAAGRAAKLVVAKVGNDGTLTLSSTVLTHAGARNAVASEDGTAWIADGPDGKILVAPPR
jgi:DNA-binding beta-propeller fold protein YncE